MTQLVPKSVFDFEDFVEKSHDDGYQCGQHHALYAEGAEGDFGAADAHNDDDRCHYQVAGFGVVNLAIHQNPETADGDNAEEQDADAAHDGYGDGADEGCQFADEAKEDGEAGRAADNPGAVYFGDGHNPDVFAIGGVGGGSGKTADDIAETVRKEGAGQARFFNQIPAHNIAGNRQVADMFRQNHEGGGGNNHNGVQIELGCVELGQLEPGGCGNAGKIHYAQADGKDVAADDPEENGDNAHEAGEGHGAHNSHRQSEEGDQNIFQDKFTGEPCHAGRNRGQFQADDGYDGAHGRRGEDDINPFRT